MTPLSSQTTADTNQGLAMGSDTAVSMASTNPQQAPLLRATYVKVIDLAVLNKLDIEKIKLETAKKKEELSCTPSTLSLKADDSSSGRAASQDDESSMNYNKYQKRVVPCSGGVNLCLLVGDVNIVVEKTRVDKSKVRLAECEVGDETGTLSLRARDDQINLLQEISKRNGAVVLRNCSLELFQGKFIRLAVSKWGKIHSFPDSISSTPSPPAKINDSIHLSIVDLNAVTGDDWNESQWSQNSSNRNAQRDAGAVSADNYNSRDKHLGHPSHSPRPRHGRRGNEGRGQASHPNDERKYRYKETAAAAQGRAYNTNVVQVVPGMPSLPLYAAPQYNYNRFDQLPLQNPYHPQHQHQNQQHQHQQQPSQEDMSYMSYQEYTMRMQMEAMRLNYSHQHQQHQNRAGSHLYHPLSPTRGMQQVPHNPDGFPDSQGRNQSQFSLHHQESVNPNKILPTSPVASMASAPGSNVPTTDTSEQVGSPYAQSANTTDGWSIRQEAESPMMNPNAAVFNSVYNMPSLTLPAQHYYAQNPSFSSFTPYTQGGQTQGQFPPSTSNAIATEESRPDLRTRDSSLQDKAKNHPK